MDTAVGCQPVLWGCRGRIPTASGHAFISRPTQNPCLGVLLFRDAPPSGSCGLADIELTALVESCLAEGI